MSLTIKDSLSKQYKNITGHISMYVCGPTVYDYCHIGHGRSYINFDFIRRILIAHQSIKSLKYCQNITDVADKIRYKGEKMGKNEKETADFFIESMAQDFKNMNILTPDVQPRVSEHIDEISNYIEKLLANKSAYITEDTIYFDISTINYGFFQSYDSPVNRIVQDKSKKNYKDFALWKFDESGYNSSLGKGFPGWHIECSAMMEKHLGKRINIHGGGIDLKHTHHENEIAQSMGLNKFHPVDIWIHNEMIHTDKEEKMSKSLGNCIYLKDLIKNKFHGDVLRYMVLSYDISSIIKFSQKSWGDAKKNMLKWRSVYKKTDNKYEDLICLDNSQLIRTANDLLKKKEYDQFSYLVDLMGFHMGQPKGIENLLEQMNQARTDKNYELSDQIRDQLLDLGYNIFN